MSAEHASLYFMLLAAPPHPLSEVSGSATGVTAESLNYDKRQHRTTLAILTLALLTDGSVDWNCPFGYNCTSRKGLETRLYLTLVSKYTSVGHRMCVFECNPTAQQRLECMRQGKWPNPPTPGTPQTMRSQERELLQQTIRHHVSYSILPWYRQFPLQTLQMQINQAAFYCSWV